jgi:hypothetical protein
MTANRLTVLTSVSELYATKRIRRDRKTGRVIKTNYGNETHFQIKQVELSGFSHLCKCLDTLTRRPFSFVIRGEPLPHTDLNHTRRVNHANPDKGYPAAFTEGPRHWFAIDLDRIKRPVAIDPVTDPEGTIEYLIGLLPPELHDASCWWQFTCCQNLPGYEDTLSARLWFWSHDPLDGAALTRWARAANKAASFRLIDDSLYRVVQVHYVAAPIFEDGMRDPLPVRHGVRIGLDKTVALVIPAPDPVDPENYAAGGFIGIGVDGFLAQIGGADGFRKPVVAAIASYFATNGADASPGPIKAKVCEAINGADPEGRSAADIVRYCSDKHLDDIIAWVRAHERGKPVSARPSPAELCTAVPIGDERPKALQTILRHLLIQRYLDPHLAVALVQCFNEVRCSPPLPSEQVTAIAHAVATGEIKKAEQRRG